MLQQITTNDRETLTYLWLLFGTMYYFFLCGLFWNGNDLVTLAHSIHRRFSHRKGE